MLHLQVSRYKMLGEHILKDEDFLEPLIATGSSTAVPRVWKTHCVPFSHSSISSCYSKATLLVRFSST